MSSEPIRISSELDTKIATILDEMASMEQLVVAFSGGVDSSVVAALAHRALGEAAVAVTAVSETLAGRELEDAKEIAAEIGIRHELMAFSELDDPRFKANTSARCFFCQSMRFDHLREIAERIGCDVLASGTNADDVGDHRPGLKAMEERRVYQPLLEHDVTKSEVRDIARKLDLSVWNKPAAACLSSRIPHGLEVTEERLRRIERAEDVLASHNFRQFRVRDHDGLARIEAATDEMDRLLQPDMLRAVTAGVRAAGFDVVTVDIAGYRTGSLNPDDRE